MNNMVKLVSITEPKLDGIDTAEELIAYCARVSNPENQNNKLTAKKLLQYCAKNKHWSIFEMIDVVIEIETTRTIGRQILRHRSFSFQEFSQRYAEVTEEMFTITEARLQDTTNRQNSLAMDQRVDDDGVLISEKWNHYQQHFIFEAIKVYKWAISNGIAKEQARVILPEGLTMSRMYMKGSLRSWIHYCHLRMGNGTQKEHQEIAVKCWNIIVEQFPALKDILEQ